MTELIIRGDKLRTRDAPTPRDVPRGARTFDPTVLREPKTREYLWLCPLDTCRRTVRMEYNRNDALYCCMGGPRAHPKQLLVCESFDVYQECFFRWMKKGENLGKPIIYPRNYFRFPRLRGGEIMRDVGEATTRDA